MNREKIKTSLFALAMVLFIAVPLYMIHRYQAVLDEGTVYRFSCKPIDPDDAFRGKFVALNFTASEFNYPHADSTFKNEETVYVTVTTDSLGFAKVINVSDNEGTGDNYFKATINYAYSNWLHLEFPFDRYYMNENSAPKAEQAYHNSAWRQNDSTYVTVRVHNGTAVLEELYVHDMPIKEYIKRPHPNSP